MKRINFSRVLLGGILAGVLLFMADGFIHSKLLHEHWMAAMKAAGRSVEAEEHGSDMLYFAAFELLRGLALAWVYSVFRTHYGPGPGPRSAPGSPCGRSCSPSSSSRRSRSASTARR